MASSPMEATDETLNVMTMISAPNEARSIAPTPQD
jgi:hypothetical protein